MLLGNDISSVFNTEVNSYFFCNVLCWTAGVLYCNVTLIKCYTCAYIDVYINVTPPVMKK